MGRYICTIDYDNLKNLFYDYTEEEIADLYDKYNGVSLFKKTTDEITDFDIEEFLIYQNQLICIYDKDKEFFTDEKIKNNVYEIISQNKKEEKRIC